MPLYEYECDACGHRFERIQKFSDPLADRCPKCGGDVHKLMSSPAIQFKGSGFYITDYAKKDHVAAAKADHDSSTKSDKSEKSDKSDSGSKSDKGSTSGDSAPASSSTASSASTTPGSSGSSGASTAPASSTSKDSKS
jgi:putative FmdB family regulatory protein